MLQLLVQVRTQELEPGGADIPVTEANRLQYCYLLAHWHLHGRLSASAGAFASGLAQVPSSWPCTDGCRTALEASGSSRAAACTHKHPKLSCNEPSLPSGLGRPGRKHAHVMDSGHATIHPASSAAYVSLLPVALGSLLNGDTCKSLTMQVSADARLFLM